MYGTPVHNGEVDSFSAAMSVHALDEVLACYGLGGVAKQHERPPKKSGDTVANSLENASAPIRRLGNRS